MPYATLPRRRFRHFASHFLRLLSAEFFAAATPRLPPLLRRYIAAACCVHTYATILATPLYIAERYVIVGIAAALSPL